ncbi:T9SS type A sorting domain-containing protein [Paraflavitalea speifideaquila]|uniref:T9SS type A sorting domain-containing protein n=1 Tax=Paraflavitalea speifideaquila TaxID=3076558 RepID=UPI0028E6FFE6|nr:T9SS type A sorting domain-containing protein [Paraflavitalea speifideiaquila]
MFLKLNASTGAFTNAIGVGNTGLDDGVACVFDPSTQDIMAAGYYNSATLQFGTNTPLTNEGNFDAWYVRYNPATNLFVWSNGAGGSTGGSDRAYDITTNGTGAIFVVGTFRGVFDIPTNLPAFTLNNTNIADDIFLARINAADGNGQLLAQGAGPAGNTISNVGFSCTAGASGSIWIAGSYSNNITLAPLAPLAAVGGTADILLARYNDPVLTATQSQTDVTCNVGCNGTATVTPSGGVAPLTYTWVGSASTTGTASGLCVGATPSVTVKDAIGQTVSKNYTITMPATSLATANTTNTTFVVSASNNNIYDATCKLITTVVPNGANPVSGTVAARVWFEAGVPVFGGTPYVARHYEIAPATGAATATGRITLYYTQAEFTAFNGAPNTPAKLPTGPGDAAGKANVRFTRYGGVSSNPATGLPATYAGAGTIIDPVDGDVVWNATLSRWEISFNAVGFSGFFMQSSFAVLPVSWVSVNGLLNQQGQPVISWKVQEQDVASYSIEKSIDGQPYTSIVTISSKGDGENEYSFQELQALSGKANYRIKQTDHNGRVTYSKVLLLKSDRKGWITLYPNPVKRTAILNVTDKELLNTVARLYDGTGREVQRIQITQSVTTIHMDQLNAGVYTLKLMNGQTMRILKE